MTRSTVKLTIALALLALAALPAGCSNQGEGQLCSRNNGNADCEGDLVCTTVSQINAGDLPNLGVCCPQNAVSTKYDCQPHASASTSSSSGAGGGASSSSSSASSSGAGGGGGASSSSASSSSVSSSASSSGSSSSGGQDGGP